MDKLDLRLELLGLDRIEWGFFVKGVFIVFNLSSGEVELSDYDGFSFEFRVCGTNSPCFIAAIRLQVVRESGLRLFIRMGARSLADLRARK